MVACNANAGADSGSYFFMRFSRPLTSFLLFFLKAAFFLHGVKPAYGCTSRANAASTGIEAATIAAATNAADFFAVSEASQEIAFTEVFLVDFSAFKLLVGETFKVCFIYKRYMRENI